MDVGCVYASRCNVFPSTSVIGVARIYDWRPGFFIIDANRFFLLALQLNLVLSAYCTAVLLSHDNAFQVFRLES